MVGSKGGRAGRCEGGIWARGVVTYVLLLPVSGVHGVVPRVGNLGGSVGVGCMAQRIPHKGAEREREKGIAHRVSFRPRGWEKKKLRISSRLSAFSRQSPCEKVAGGGIRRREGARHRERVATGRRERVWTLDVRL